MFGRFLKVPKMPHKILQYIRNLFPHARITCTLRYADETFWSGSRLEQLVTLAQYCQSCVLLLGRPPAVSRTTGARRVEEQSPLRRQEAKTLLRMGRSRVGPRLEGRAPDAPHVGLATNVGHHSGTTKNKSTRGTN